MLKILTPLDLRTMGESGKFKLINELHFEHPITGLQKVKKGFVTDFASIPGFFRRMFNVNGRHREEAVVHDWLYFNRGRIGAKKLTRKQCDQIFFDGLKREKINFFKRHAMHKAVRMFGGLHLKMTNGGSWK